MLEAFTTDTFRPLVGQDFRIDGGGNLLRLSAATDWPVRAGPLRVADKRAPFTLLFHGGETDFLPQGTYTVEHPELGQFPLFLVPVGPDEQGMRYEAVFA